MPKFLISILCLNRFEYTKACVTAVIANSSDYELILTNNGSTDETREWLQNLADNNDHITLINHDENQGFIIPMNTAFDYAVKLGIPYFVALNNDTLPPFGWLDKLVAPLENNPMAALSGPAGGYCALSEQFYGCNGPVEYLEGSCLMVKVRPLVVNDEQLFSSDYLEMAYGEDSDLSLRMRRRGYSIHKVADLEVPNLDRAGTVATVLPEIPEMHKRLSVAFERNHATLRKVWAGYLLSRKFGP